MAVYVDNMKARFGRLIMCHMIADTEEELHQMADAIGVSRRWWQSPESTSGSHYDIALSKRALAVKAGAKEVTLRECGCMNLHRKVHGHLCAPEVAVAWARERFKLKPLDLYTNSEVV
ncbi:DUF4031 domain-containing protein [Halopseudomonas sp.]|uniref:DUF4031 domain-containing protein n=1 Tax=Halopseudomonas sp. TaxID=2901191 RepID=UPI0030032E28